MSFFSSLITPTTAPQLIMTNKSGISRVTQIQIAVRSMGTSSFSAIGGVDEQSRRLTAVGDNIGMDTPQGKRYLDISKLFIVSDTADAVIEIIGDTYDGP